MVLSGDSVHHQQLNATLCLLRPVAGWSILVSFEEFRWEVVGLWFVEQPGHSTFLIASFVGWRVDAAGAGDCGRRSQGDSAPGHFAIVMLGTPTRGTSVTVIWNNRYNNWNASRFQRASGPVVFTA